MRRDRLLLQSGYVASAGLAAATYLMGFGWVASLGALLGSALLARSLVYVYYERTLAFRTFEDFTSGKIKHECIACGASCHLRVSLGKNDLERILKYEGGWDTGGGGGEEWRQVLAGEEIGRRMRVSHIFREHSTMSSLPHKADRMQALSPDPNG